MTGRPGTSGLRQVGSLFAALGVGAGLVAVLAVVEPDLAQLPVAEGEGGQLVEAWRSDDGAPSGREGSGGVVEPQATASASPSDDAEPASAEPGEPSEAPTKKQAEVTEEPAEEPSEEPAEEPTEPAEEPTKRAEPTEEPAEEPTEPAEEPADEPGAPAVEVLALVNTERASAGCGALAGDPALDALAAAHSADMRDRGYFSHTDPDGRSPWDRAEAAGLSGVAAENIARGQPDAAAVVAAWMDSPGHRENILDCGLTRHGLGAAEGSGGPWWTQVFGR